LLSYQTGGLTLAFEWDLWDVYVIDMWNIMLLANYQFNDVFGLTFRYSHEDFEANVPGGGEGSSNRFTIGPMFSVTNNLTVGIEYSHAELDSTNIAGGDSSVDELYAETIFSF
jgi:predicted porin